GDGCASARRDRGAHGRRIASQFEKGVVPRIVAKTTGARSAAAYKGVHRYRSSPFGPASFQDVDWRYARNSWRTGAWLDLRRWRGDFRSDRARPNLPRQGNRCRMARRASDLAFDGWPQYVHNALRTYRNACSSG